MCRICEGFSDHWTPNQDDPTFVGAYVGAHYQLTAEMEARARRDSHQGGRDLDRNMYSVAGRTTAATRSRLSNVSCKRLQTNPWPPMTARTHPVQEDRTRHRFHNGEANTTGENGTTGDVHHGPGQRHPHHGRGRHHHNLDPRHRGWRASRQQRQNREKSD